MSRMTGAKGAVRRAKARPAALDDAAMRQITSTVTAVHSLGRANLDSMTVKRSGLLRGWYRKSIRKASISGFVGYVSARARRAAWYARFVHDGTAVAAARPFHADAVEEVGPVHEAGMRSAVGDAIKRTSPSGLARTGGGAERDVI